MLMMYALTFSRMCSLQTSPASRSSFSVCSPTSFTSFPLRLTLVIPYNDLMLSMLHRSSVCRSRSVMIAPVTERKCGSLIIVRAICSKMFVKSWCVATTLTEQGSAGLTPTSVEKIRLVNRSFLSPYMLRSCFPIWVSLLER